MLSSLLPLLLLLSPLLVASHDASIPDYQRRHVARAQAQRMEKLVLKRQILNANNGTVASTVGLGVITNTVIGGAVTTTTAAGAAGGVESASSASAAATTDTSVANIVTTTSTSAGLLGEITSALVPVTTTSSVSAALLSTTSSSAPLLSSSSSSVAAGVASTTSITSKVTTTKSAAATTGKSSVTGSSSSSSSSSSATAAAASTSTKSTGLSKSTLIPIIVVASSVALIAAIWTIVRKTKFSPSRRFEAKLEPIDFVPSRRDSFEDPDFPGHGRSASAMSGSIHKGSGTALGRAGTLMGTGGAGAAYPQSLARSDSDASLRRAPMAEVSRIPGAIPYNNPGTYGQTPYRGPTPGPGYNNEQAYGYSDLQRGQSTRNFGGGGMYDYGAQARAQQHQYGHY